MLLKKLKREMVGKGVRHKKPSALRLSPQNEEGKQWSGPQKKGLKEGQLELHCSRALDFSMQYRANSPKRNEKRSCW